MWLLAGYGREACLGHTLTDAEVREDGAAEGSVRGFGRYALAAKLRGTGEVIGRCGLTMQPCRELSRLRRMILMPCDHGSGRAFAGVKGALHVPEVGYMLNRRYRGRSA